MTAYFFDILFYKMIFRRPYKKIVFFTSFYCFLLWWEKFIFVLRAVTEHYDNIDIDTLNFGISQSGCLPSNALNNNDAGIDNKAINAAIS